MPSLLVPENKKCLFTMILSTVFLLFLIYGLDFDWLGTKRNIEPNIENRTKASLKQYLPNTILIGVRKGGTRALLRALLLNHNIKTASKEVHFFDRNENYQKGIEWYRKKMPFVSTAASQQIIMEKTPAYFVTLTVPRRIYNMSKTVKLLVVVRNPARRAISDYAQLKSKNPSMPPFEEYITKDKYQKILNINETSIRIGIYGNHLQNWLKYFPLEQIHFVSGEKLSSNPVPELQNVERFLNLKSVITEKDIKFNKTKGFPCFKKHLRENNGNPEYACLGPGKGRTHPIVRPDILHLLMTYYSPYNKQFYRMVNRDFGWV